MVDLTGFNTLPTMNTPARFSHTGLKSTLPRLRVMDVFVHSSLRHLSAEDVYTQLRVQGEALGLSTVYKVLSQFEQTGVLRRNELGQGRMVYELNDDDAPHHGHLVCTHTGRVIEFEVPDLHRHLHQLAQAHGLVLTHCVVTAYAQPTSCRNSLPST